VYASIALCAKAGAAIAARADAIMIFFIIYLLKDWIV
jgi:hypothetical protein